MNRNEFLAFSLPYDVKAIDKFECIWTIHPYKDALDDLKDNEHLSYENFIKEEGHRLILHPLSDLTKEIEHKGEKFVPIEELREIIGGSWCGVYEGVVELIQEWDIDTLKDKIKYLPFEFIQLFISWQFDIADLLSKGEAIDVNTLEENPYK